MQQPRKIIWAKSDKVDALRPYVDKVLEAIGQDQPHAINAMVTDRSCVGDFYIVGMEDKTDASISEEEYRRQMLMLQHRLNIGVQGSDLIVDVANRIREVVEQ